MQEWYYLFASVRGKGHFEENIPCQDSCEVFPHTGYTICVVSDGAGSCENSNIGSAKATAFANIHFSGLVEEKKWDKGKKKIALSEWQQVSQITLKAIRDDLEKVSIEGGFDFKSLSCTLIVIIQIKNKLLLTHIGDGRAGYCNSKDEWAAMLTPYKGRYSNETVFITSDIWENETNTNKYIKSAIVEENIKAFCLLSDGCENASFECYKLDEVTQIPEDINKPYKEFFHENVNFHIPNLIKSQKSQEELNQIWKSFLTDGNDTLKNESDDKSMILAVKMPLLES
jgi:serine/threonine protein phosphatase PrpC